MEVNFQLFLLTLIVKSQNFNRYSLKVITTLRPGLEPTLTRFEQSGFHCRSLLVIARKTGTFAGEEYESGALFSPSRSPAKQKKNKGLILLGPTVVT